MARSKWLALALVLVLSGCKPLDDALASVPIFAFMRAAPAYESYEAPRPAPPNTVPFASPVGVPEPPVENTEQARIAWGEANPNPWAGRPETLEAGQRFYERYCLVCHGETGRGDGPAVGPGKVVQLSTMDLTSAATAARTDGYIYLMIRMGRGLMPSYERVPPDERWWIVNYIRQLQQQAGTLTAAQSAGAAAPGGN
ncbi:MAG TPA: cytochrome c [Longimicrobiales bacterium]|nr:cytochrome c [Longimicrobiales bacterium]